MIAEQEARAGLVGEVQGWVRQDGAEVTMVHARQRAGQAPNLPPKPHSPTAVTWTATEKRTRSALLPDAGETGPAEGGCGEELVSSEFCNSTGVQTLVTLPGSAAVDRRLEYAAVVADPVPTCPLGAVQCRVGLSD